MNSLLPIQARKSLKKLCNRKYSTFGNLQVKNHFENTNRSLNCCKYLHIPLENQEAPESKTANPLENFQLPFTLLTFLPNDPTEQNLFITTIHFKSQENNTNLLQGTLKTENLFLFNNSIVYQVLFI